MGKGARAPNGKASAGFTLVDILVGMAIGILTIIVIMNSMAAFEGQKRTTTTGSDTQESGLLALQAIEADARNAGYGLLTPKGLACTTMNYYESGTSGTISLAPVKIEEGGTAAGASDKLTFIAATSPIAGMPSKLNADMPDSTADAVIDNSVGFTVDQDLYLVAAPIPSPGTGAVETACSRMAYTERCPWDTTLPEVVCPGKTFLSAASPVAIFNTSSASFFPVGGYSASNGYVINIGSGLNGAAGLLRREYSISGNNLTVTDKSRVTAQTPSVIGNNIVNMQIQYGVAPTNTAPGASSPAVNCWTDAKGNACTPSSGDWATPNAADIMRIKAIRIALVARSPLQGKPSGGGAQCDATKGPLTSWVGGPAIDLTNDAKWQCYRYQVYQTIIPLRNVIWANI